VIVHHDDSLPQYDKTFPKFPLLPKEIRLLIWKYAVPPPRHFAQDHCGVLLIVNFELARPKVILPSPRDLWFMFPHEGPEDARHHKKSTVWEWQMGIFTLLHACRESRAVTQEEYRLDLKSAIPEENEPWWSDEDVVYFPTGGDDRSRDAALLRWMSRKRSGRMHCLQSIHHIAMEATHAAVKAMGFLAQDGSEDGSEVSESDLPLDRPNDGWRFEWPGNFRALESLSLMFDPGEVEGSENGSLRLYKPYDVVVQGLGLKPSQIEERAVRKLLEASEMDDDDVVDSEEDDSEDGSDGD